MTILTEEKLLADVSAGMSGHAIARKYGMTPPPVTLTVASNASVRAVLVTVAMCLALCRTVTR